MNALFVLEIGGLNIQQCKNCLLSVKVCVVIKQGRQSSVVQPSGMMKIFTRVIVISTLMVCFIIAILIYLSCNRVNFNDIIKLRDIGNSVDRTSERPKKRAMQLLTIFTTIKETGDTPHHQLAFNIVMTNWPSFAPYVRPVVFLNFTNSSLANEARLAGWDVLPLEGANEAGTPFLKDMYRTAFDRCESVFYGFANADILFDDGLVRTLLEVRSKLKELSSNVLVMGIRTNVNVDLNNTVLFEAFEKHRIRDLAARKGRLFGGDAIDYFFFTNEGRIYYSRPY